MSKGKPTLRHWYDTLLAKDWERAIEKTKEQAEHVRLMEEAERTAAKLAELDREKMTLLIIQNPAKFSGLVVLKARDHALKICERSDSIISILEAIRSSARQSK